MANEHHAHAPAPPEEQPVEEASLIEILAAIDDGQIVPHYQPLVSLGSHRLIGVEALARWDRPDRLHIGPSQFVASLERARCVSRLTARMLDRASGDLAAWQRHFRLPRHFRVAVNVSATELMDHRLVTMAAAAIDRHGIPPTALCLELTETARIEDPATAVEVFVRLRELGVRVAIDDFGVGFTTPLHFETLPFDMVKIDHSYVADVERRQDCADFITRTVAAATRRKVDVLAEGVETLGQARTLQLLGCRHGQGWSFGRAAPADAVLSAWVTARAPAL
jgi:EAL domain-containing protein (putative c-di-GMP-specific phosphodiesterase class I)